RTGPCRPGPARHGAGSAALEQGGTPIYFQHVPRRACAAVGRSHTLRASATMLNLSFIFEDANTSLAKYADRLAVVPLPAAVYMMQVDVLNHYRYALSHYLMLTLDEPYLQNSSLGTPYQKWAYFVNENFEMLSFAIHNLMRYTSRLVHETRRPTPGDSVDSL